MLFDTPHGYRGSWREQLGGQQGRAELDVCEASEGPFPVGLTGEDWAGEGKQVYGLPRRYDDMRNRFNGRKCMAQAVSVKTKHNNNNNNKNAGRVEPPWIEEEKQQVLIGLPPLPHPR